MTCYFVLVDKCYTFIFYSYVCKYVCMLKWRLLSKHLQSNNNEQNESWTRLSIHSIWNLLSNGFLLSLRWQKEIWHPKKEKNWRMHIAHIKKECYIGGKGKKSQRNAHFKCLLLRCCWAICSAISLTHNENMWYICIFLTKLTFVHQETKTSCCLSIVHVNKICFHSKMQIWNIKACNESIFALSKFWRKWRKK